MTSDGTRAPSSDGERSALNESDIPDERVASGAYPRKVRPRRSIGPKIQSDLSGKQQIQGERAADRYIRVVRAQHGHFVPAGPGLLVATPGASEPAGSISRGYAKVKRVLIGAPIATAAAAHERLTKIKALAVLSSDALSSVAYATEEILRVLLLAGGAALSRQLADRRGDRGAADRRRHLLPPDDQGLPARRRQLHRRQGQPGRLPALTAGAAP